MNIEIVRNIKREALFNRNPELLAVVGGIRFYDCPVYGDERPLVAVTAEICGYSQYWDVPTLNELLN